MLRRSFSIVNSYGELIRGDIRHIENIKEAPVIVICHGFKGFKDWGFFPSLAEDLAETGYASVVFNFSRNGIGHDLQNFTEHELFAKNTYSHELEDLGFVINALRSGQIGKGIIDSARIGLLGHSRGGGIVLLYAADDSNIETIVTWATISQVNRFNKDQIKSWKSDGFIAIENKRTRQMMRIDHNLLNDIQKNADRLDILAAARKLKMPVTLIHGDNDDSVPKSESQEIFKNLTSEFKELHIIENTNHTFGITHPMQTRTEDYTTALDLTETWFDRYLLV